MPHHKDMNFTMDIMMLLDTQNVRNLRKEFEKTEDGLSLHQFVDVMSSFLKGEGEVHTVVYACFFVL